jgi:hypothetical protein
MRQQTNAAKWWHFGQLSGILATDQGKRDTLMHRSRDDSHEDDARRFPCLEPTPSVHTHELESSLLPLPIVEVRRHRSLAHGRWKRIQQAASLLSKSRQHTNGHGIRCCLTPCMSASLILGYTSGVEQDGAVLVRPGGHVAWRA